MPSSMQIACCLGDIDMVMNLARCDILRIIKNTLILACGSAGPDSVAVVRWLLNEPKCDSINCRGENDESPLHVAARAGNAKVVLLLLYSGAIPTIRDADNLTPRDYALSAGYDNMALLLEAAEVEYCG